MFVLPEQIYFIHASGASANRKKIDCCRCVTVRSTCMYADTTRGWEHLPACLSSLDWTKRPLLHTIVGKFLREPFFFFFLFLRKFRKKPVHSVIHYNKDKTWYGKLKSHIFIIVKSHHHTHPLANKHTSFQLPIANDGTKLGFMHYYKEMGNISARPSSDIWTI